LDLDVEELLREKARVYAELAASSIDSYPGVKELVGELNSAGVAVGLVTGASRREVQMILRELGLTKDFGVVVAADDVTRGKPNPEGYMKAAEALGVDAKHSVVIEDTPSGISAARAARMRCVAVTNTFPASNLSDADLILDELGPGCLKVLEKR
jgi:sugar-phosphatase